MAFSNSEPEEQNTWCWWAKTTDTKIKYKERVKAKRFLPHQHEAEKSSSKLTSPLLTSYMATAARAFTLSRVTALSPDPLHSRHSFSRHHHHLLRCFPVHRRFSAPFSATVSCLSGGGVFNDDFVSTRKSNFDRGFLVIANMLKRIEPLDTSVISKGVSDAAKDSMKQTISTMLGLLPSDQFSINVTVSKQPLDSLLASSIITG